MAGERICPLTALPERASRGHGPCAGKQAASVFVVRVGDRVYGYRNACPHTGAPMEWQTHRFLDLSGQYIVYGVHGAVFRIEDGYCLEGPCRRSYLQPVPVAVRDGWVWLR